MKRHLIFLTIFSVIIVSCKNKNETKIQNLETEVSENNIEKSEPIKAEVKEIQEKSFDWSKSEVLKQNFLNALSESDLPQDKVVIDYLNTYSKLVYEFNDILFEKSNYDSLNTLVHLNPDKIYKCASDFKNQVETNGFTIAFSEGTIYIKENTNFIKSETIELLDSISVEFLNLYCLEIDTVCCEDGGINISKRELVNRILNWGNFIEKASETKYMEIAKPEFFSNLSLLYRGQNNTPAFDRVSGKYNQVSFDLIQNVINQFPNSITAKEFKEFSELIVKENFERTENVNEFLDSKFK